MPSTEFVFKDPRNALAIKGKSFTIRVKVGEHVIPRFHGVSEENFDHLRIKKGTVWIKVSKAGKVVDEHLVQSNSYELKNHNPLTIAVRTDAEIEFSSARLNFSTPLPDANSEVVINPN